MTRLLLIVFLLAPFGALAQSDPVYCAGTKVDIEFRYAECTYPTEPCYEVEGTQEWSDYPDCTGAAATKPFVRPKL
jgi:hypothetical protein